MSTITPALLKTLRTEISAALAEVAKRHGLQTLTAGAATYTANHFTFKLDGVVEGGLTKEAERYSSSIELLGLPPLGTFFRSGATDYKTVGLNTTGSKVICERSDGKQYLIPLETCIDRCKS